MQTSIDNVKFVQTEDDLICDFDVHIDGKKVGRGSSWFPDGAFWLDFDISDEVHDKIYDLVEDEIDRHLRNV